MQCTGTSYADFVRAMHLPSNLAAVDPIVAAFCGGAVGVLSALLVVEANNAKVSSASIGCPLQGGHSPDMGKTDLAAPSVFTCFWLA